MRVLAACCAASFASIITEANGSCGAAFCLINTDWSAQGTWVEDGARVDLRYESIDLDQVHSNGYGFQIEVTYRCYKRGLRIVETPIIFVDRRVGQSKMSRHIVLEAMLMVWRLRFRA